jgi:hypothetical protein
MRARKVSDDSPKGDEMTNPEVSPYVPVEFHAEVAQEFHVEAALVFQAEAALQTPPVTWPVTPPETSATDIGRNSAETPAAEETTSEKSAETSAGISSETPFYYGIGQAPEHRPDQYPERRPEYHPDSPSNSPQKTPPEVKVVPREAPLRSFRKIVMTRPYGFVADNGQAYHWFQGETIEDLRVIALLVERGCSDFTEIDGY